MASSGQCTTLFNLLLFCASPSSKPPSFITCLLLSVYLILGLPFDQIPATRILIMCFTLFPTSYECVRDINIKHIMYPLMGALASCPLSGTSASCNASCQHGLIITVIMKSVFRPMSPILWIIQVGKRRQFKSTVCMRVCKQIAAILFIKCVCQAGSVIMITVYCTSVDRQPNLHMASPYHSSHCDRTQVSAFHTWFIFVLQLYVTYLGLLRYLHDRRL